MGLNNRYFSNTKRRKPKKLVPGQDKTTAIGGINAKEVLVRDGVSKFALKLKRNNNNKNSKYFSVK